LYNFPVFFFFGNLWFYFILARKKKLLYIIKQTGKLVSPSINCD